MTSQKLSFDNGRGQQLTARLDRPDSREPEGFAILAHCFTCTMNLKAIANINRALTDAGIAVLRFDFTGLGESEGDFAETNFTSNTQDLVAASEYLEREHEAPGILIGHSLGGAAVIQAAADIPSSRAVATIGAPCEPKHVERLLGDSDTIREEGEAEINLAGRVFKITSQFIEDLEESRMNDRIRHLKRALLVLHSPIDDIVGIENAAHIFHSARHPKSFVSLDTADHLLMKERDSIYAGRMISVWASRYINN
jgi:putative redox protein